MQSKGASEQSSFEKESLDGQMYEEAKRKGPSIQTLCSFIVYIYLSRQMMAGRAGSELDGARTKGGEGLLIGDSKKKKKMKKSSHSVDRSLLLSIAHHHAPNINIS